MKQAVKIVITVMVAICSGFVCLLAIGYYTGETSYLEYDIESLIEPVLLEAEVSDLPEEYVIENREEGRNLYLLAVTFDNPSNCGLEGYQINLRYEASDSGETYWIREEGENFSTYRNWENGYYLPAGKQTTFYAVVSVNDGCEKFDVIYYNYQTKSEQRVPVEL